MENGRIRIADIAEELGLSTATVSNVIHGKTKKISVKSSVQPQVQISKLNQTTLYEAMHILRKKCV